MSESGELVSQLAVIEEQPLAERAAGSAQLAEQLRTQLEQADSE
ncbi:MAG: hypothetical protein ACKOXM_03860 [Agromyces sp.]